MNFKVIKYITLGIAAYAIFATSVIYYYKNNPEALPWDDREEFNRKYIAGLSLSDNINRTGIIERLGSPDLSEAKQSADDQFQVLFYRTQHKKSDGITSLDECTAMLFKNGELIAWGESAYEQYKNQQLAQ